MNIDNQLCDWLDILKERGNEYEGLYKRDIQKLEDVKTILKELDSFLLMSQAMIEQIKAITDNHIIVAESFDGAYQIGLIENRLKLLQSLTKG